MGPAKHHLWTDGMRDRLRVAWHDASLSMEQLGQAVGKSASACRNEAQRLGLPLRVTIRGVNPGAAALHPIPPPPRPRPLQPGARTLPLLPSEEAELRDHPTGGSEAPGRM